jgi:hypothetical protein
VTEKGLFFYVYVSILFTITNKRARALQRKKIIISNGYDHILFTSHSMISKIRSQMQEIVPLFKFNDKLNICSHLHKNIMVVKKLGISKNYSEFQEMFFKHIIIFDLPRRLILQNSRGYTVTKTLKHYYLITYVRTFVNIFTNLGRFFKIVNIFKILNIFLYCEYFKHFLLNRQTILE